MSQINSCATCSNTWTGNRPAHCSACHNTFAGVSLFDQHRVNYTCQPVVNTILVDGIIRSTIVNPLFASAEKVEAAAEVELTEAQIVRAWAIEHGFAKPTRGRLSADARAAYAAAHGGPEFTPKTPEEVEAASAPSEVSIIRAWARDNGFQVGVKGRLAPAITEAYAAAHPAPVAL